MTIGKLETVKLEPMIELHVNIWRNRRIELKVNIWRNAWIMMSSDLHQVRLLRLLSWYGRRTGHCDCVSTIEH